MPPRCISGIERGLRSPTFLKLCGIADALHIPVSAVAKETETEAQLAVRMSEARRDLGLAE
jgi:transcriptional regulator with XRE-family HTH domain